MVHFSVTCAINVISIYQKYELFNYLIWLKFKSWRFKFEFKLNQIFYGLILKKQIAIESPSYINEINAKIQEEKPNYGFLYIETHFMH